MLLAGEAQVRAKCNKFHAFYPHLFLCFSFSCHTLVRHKTNQQQQSCRVVSNERFHRQKQNSADSFHELQLGAAPRCESAWLRWQASWRRNGCVVTGRMLLCISYFLAPFTAHESLSSCHTDVAGYQTGSPLVYTPCLLRRVCVGVLCADSIFYGHMYLQHSIAHRLYNFVGFCGFMICGNAYAMSVCQRKIAIEEITLKCSASKMKNASRPQ